MVTLLNVCASIQIISFFIDNAYAQSDNSISFLQLMSRVEALEKHDLEQNEAMAKLHHKLDFQAKMLNDQVHTIEKQHQETDNINMKVTRQQMELEEKDMRMSIQAKHMANIEKELKQLNTLLNVLQGNVIKDKKTHGQNMDTKRYPDGIRNNANHQRTTMKQETHRHNMDTKSDSDVSNDNASQSEHSINPMETQPNVRRRQIETVAVAFHAVVDTIHVSHIGMGQNIKFDVVLTNLGDGYHNQHGLFIAPRAGIYIFSTTIMCYNDLHNEIQADIKKNGNVLARVLADGHVGHNQGFDQGSVTIVTQLDTGDEVWVSENYPADSSLYGGRYTSFMGCLIAPM